jgi:hypothetical protein
VFCNFIATRNAIEMCGRASKILLQARHCKFAASEKSEEFHIRWLGANVLLPRNSTDQTPHWIKSKHLFVSGSILKTIGNVFQ